MRSFTEDITPSVRPNAFTASFLGRLAERDEPPTAREADVAGPSRIEPLPGHGFGLFRVDESLGRGFVPEAQARVPDLQEIGQGTRVKAPGVLGIGQGTSAKVPGIQAIGQGTRPKAPGLSAIGQGTSPKVLGLSVIGQGTRAKVPGISVIGLGTRAKVPGL